MSINLHLESDIGEFPLWQTDSNTTRMCMKLYDTGNTGEAAAEYALSGYVFFLVNRNIDEDVITSHVNKIRLFLTTPGARFFAS